MRRFVSVSVPPIGGSPSASATTLVATLGISVVEGWNRAWVQT
jgi:hypothetical protein